VTAWRDKVFMQQHIVMRGGDLICEGFETRTFGTPA